MSNKGTESLVQNDVLQFQYNNDDFGEVPTIEEEDLADVRDDIDLSSIGAVSIAADLELQSIAVPDAVTTVSSDNSSHGENVDDDIVMDILDSAKIRRQQMNYESTKKSCFAAALFFTLVVALSLAVIIPSSRKFKEKDISEFKEKEINEVDSKLNSQGTVYGFNEKSEFGPIETSSNDKSANAVVKRVINVTKVELKVPFPAVLAKNVLDLNDGVFDHNTETPFFWQVPLSGSSVQSIMTGCLDLVLASSIGDKENIFPKDLKIIKVGSQEYVDVNLGNQGGIDHAHDLALGTSGMADVIVSHHLHYAVRRIFDPDHKTRAFTMLRHPLERALSAYHNFVKHANDELISTMTLKEYVDSVWVEDNWLTRFLTNHRNGNLGHDQINVAKEILRRKFLIGMYDRFEDSMARFETYFGWHITFPPGHVQADAVCHAKMIAHARDRDREDYLKLGVDILQGDPIYNKLKELNRYDLEVYWYAVELFDEQAAFIKSISDKH